MRFIGGLLASFAVTLFGLTLLPRLVLATPLDDLNSCMAACQTGVAAAMASCNSNSDPAVAEACRASVSDPTCSRCQEEYLRATVQDEPCLPFQTVGDEGVCITPADYVETAPDPNKPLEAKPAEASVVTTTNLDVAAGYNQIINGPGLIFANICPTEKPSAESGVEDTCPCRSSGRCTLDNMLQVFVNICILILSISGSIVLLMFVYGGFLWITSRGESDRVSKGKDTITNAVIGLAIILLSYTMINFTISAFAGDKPGSTIESTIDNANDGARTLNAPPPSATAIPPKP